MTVVEVTCPKHGMLTVNVQAVTLHICRTDGRLTFYTFPCPVCDQVRKPADVQVSAILIGANAEVIRWTVPAEATEPHQGPPISWDDLLDAHAALADGSFLAELLDIA